jgi:hypothetical protein
MRLTAKSVAALKPQGSRAVIWDDRLKGFGVRVSPSGRKTYVAYARVGRLQRLMTIGADAIFTVEEARERADTIIRQARDGIDPQAARRAARTAMTVAELCDAYMEAARSGLVTTRFHRPKSPATVAIDEGRINRHIKPLIGSVVAKELRRGDVQRMADAVAAGKTAGTFKGKARGKAVVTGGSGTAARVVELLGGIWSWAEKREHVTGTSPIRGVDRIRGEAKNRTLSADELQALGAAIEAAANPMAAEALRLIALTGMRREEGCGLRWAEIDTLGQCMHLAATKTGRSTRPIGKPVVELLAGLPRLSEDWVFPNRRGTGSADMKADIAAIFDAAGLKDARSHDLRRTYGSTAADLGYGDAAIAELLGHARRGVTERYYVRRSDPVMVAAASAVAEKIAAAMSGQGADVIPLRAPAAV